MKNLDFYCPHIDYKQSCLFVFNDHKQFVLYLNQQNTFKISVKLSIHLALKMYTLKP